VVRPSAAALANLPQAAAGDRIAKASAVPLERMTTMAVSLNLFLFGKPGQELDEGGSVTASQLRDLSRKLHARLEETATIVEKLTATGWEAQMGLYDINLYHPYINTAPHAEEKLRELDIDPETITIDEWEDEDDEGWAME
jgi:hypothetical protein